MGPLAWFFESTATLEVLVYPQDTAGGSVPTPTATVVQIACSIQQDDAPEPIADQDRDGSLAQITVLLLADPADPFAMAAIRALKVLDRITVDGHPLPLVVDGPAYRESGRGLVWTVACREIR